MSVATVLSLMIQSFIVALLSLVVAVVLAIKRK
ncbi:putative holin-like toxin [Alicyclobacillus kakegawensis]|nr:putative holin-like toxin [Alicyclobacillus kakegawensis]